METSLDFDDPRTKYLQNPNSRSDLVSFVDKTLPQCRQLKLKKFSVDTSYDSRFESQVNKLIHYAISRNVEELELKFWSRALQGVFLSLRYQNLFISSYLTDLTLEGFKLNPILAVSWKNLRNLCISYGNLNEDLIENILSGSPILETLMLKYCCGYRRLDITSKSVKKLVLYGYMNMYTFLGDDFIEINAPNILSLTIRGHLLLRKLLLLNVSSVVEATLDCRKMGCWKKSGKEVEEEMLKGLILSLRHVKELKLGSFCSRAMSRLEAKGFEFPSNVKFPDEIWSDNDSVESEEDL